MAVRGGVINGPLEILSAMFYCLKYSDPTFIAPKITRFHSESLVPDNLAKFIIGLSDEKMFNMFLTHFSSCSSSPVYLFVCRNDETTFISVFLTIFIITSGHQKVEINYLIIFFSFLHANFN